MKIDELLNKVVPEETIFQRRKYEIPLRMSSDGMIMDISNKNYSTYYPMKRKILFMLTIGKLLKKSFPNL